MLQVLMAVTNFKEKNMKFKNETCLEATRHRELESGEIFLEKHLMAP